MANISTADLWCATTAIDAETHRFMWRLKQFLNVEKQLLYMKVESPFFPSGSQSKTKWCLQLRKRPDLDSECFELYQKLCSATVKSVTAKLKFKCADLELGEKYRYCQYDENEGLFEPNQTEGASSFINMSKLCIPGNYRHTNDDLTLDCVVTAYFDTVISISFRSYTELTNNQRYVEANVSALLKKNRLATSSCARDQRNSLLTHKSVLSFRSSIFNALFRHEMKENKRVVIEDIDPRTLRHLLHFIYTGRADLSPEMAAHLLPAADKYRLGSLKSMCEEALCAILSSKTVARVLIFADTYNAVQLKKRALNFIDGFPYYVFDTESWKLMNGAGPQLLQECFKRRSNASSQSLEESHDPLTSHWPVKQYKEVEVVNK